MKLLTKVSDKCSCNDVAALNLFNCGVGVNLYIKQEKGRRLIYAVNLRLLWK